MDIGDRRALKQEAAQALQQASYDPKKLVLIHTAVVLGASLLVTVVSYIIAGQIENTGGLNGIGTRAILSTIQWALQLGLMVATPFWQMGLTYAALRMARKQPAEPSDLKAGFLRFGPVLRLQLMQILLCILLGILSFNLGTMLFAFTPFAVSMDQLLMQFHEQMAGDAAFVVDEVMAMALMEAMIPMFVIVFVVYMALLIPVMYKLRMADYAIMDEDRPGALKAIAISFRMMRYNRFQLFRLDLSFWWFYLLNGLTVLLAYGDTLLSMLGVTLPIPADVLYFVSYGLYIVGQLALYWWAGAQVYTTYAVTYDNLRAQRHPLHPPQPQTPPRQNPWGNWQ